MRVKLIRRTGQLTVHQHKRKNCQIECDGLLEVNLPLGTARRDAGQQ